MYSALSFLYLYVYYFYIIVTDSTCLCMYGASSLLYLYTYYCFHIIIISSICQYRQEPLAPACVCMVLCLFHTCVYMYYYLYSDSVCMHSALGPLALSQCASAVIDFSYLLTPSYIPLTILSLTHSLSAPFSFTYPSHIHPPSPHSSVTFCLYSTSPIHSLILPPLMLSPIH